MLKDELMKCLIDIKNICNDNPHEILFEENNIKEINIIKDRYHNLLKFNLTRDAIKELRINCSLLTRKISELNVDISNGLYMQATPKTKFIIIIDKKINLIDKYLI